MSETSMSAATVDANGSVARGGPGRGRDERADGPGWAPWIYPGIWLMFLLGVVGDLPRHNGPVGVVVGLVALVAFCALYLCAVQDHVLPPGWRTEVHRFPWRLIGVLVALTAIDVALAREQALTMCVFIAVVAISSLTVTGYVFVVGLAAVAVATPALIPFWHDGAKWDLLFSLIMVSFAMLGFFHMQQTTVELRDARSEVARLAALDERNRIARDLHDLLGHSLTAITVKAGLARRLGEQDDPRAVAEIAEVERLGRSSLADVRAAVAGYREVSVANELASARAVLRAAGVDPVLPGNVEHVAPERVELFGWAIREGVTNVVRHARASRCEITLGATWLQIDDDGSGDGGVAGPDGGSGLAGLRERAAATGCRITSGRVRGGWRLRVEVPEVAAL